MTDSSLTSPPANRRIKFQIYSLNISWNLLTWLLAVLEEPPFTMGALLARLFRPEDIKKQLLEIDEQIQNIQERVQSYRVRQWNWVKRVVWFGAAALLIYAIYWKFILPSRIPPLATGLYIAIYFLVPLLSWMLMKLVHYYYALRINSCQSYLKELEQKQLNALDKLKKKMDFEETQKVISRVERRLSSLHDPSFTGVAPTPPKTVSAPVLPRPGQNPPQTPQPQAPRPQATPKQPFLQPPQPEAPRGTPPSTPTRPDRPSVTATPKQAVTMPVPPTYVVAEDPSPTAAAPPQTPSLVDGLIGWLVGDGPGQSFALICNKCKKNNGMAPLAERDKIQFVCAYCRALNGPQRGPGDPASPPRPNASAAGSAAPVVESKKDQ